MPSWRDVPPRWLVNFLIALLLVAGFGLTLFVFYPGIMTYDARYVYSAIAEGRVGDWQSPAMTAVWALIDPVAPGSASMFLLIAALYWLAFAVLAFSTAPYSGRLAAALPLLALAPPAFEFVGIIWRDVLFADVWLLSAALAYAAAPQATRVRAPLQALALALLVLGLLLRPNALLAVPIVGAYILSPSRLRWKFLALAYVPAVVGFFALVQVTYYGVFNAMRQNPLHSILVFDLGGITHFARQNQFPVAFTPEQTVLVTDHCYNPELWDVYWTREPCRFVMARLEGAKIFGSPVLVDAWRRALVLHPAAYLQHRLAFMATFLAGANRTLWTQDLDDPTRPVFADRPAFEALKTVDAWLKPTPLLRSGSWLLLCVAVCIVAWRRRDTKSGAFALAACGSAIVYVMTFLAVGVAADARYALWSVLAGLTGTVAAATPKALKQTLRRG
ncbi:MAG: hypothetical protein ACLPKB_22085 [Xanthobacteraceae bacterium]